MALILSILFYAAVSIWVAVLVHESGHYLAGLTVGVPSRRMRVRLQRPPHVALWDGQAWLGPDDTTYVEVFRKYSPAAPAAWLFVGGGFLLETALTLGVVWVLAGVATELAMVVLLATTSLLAVYLISDVVGSLRMSRPAGDLSAMLKISRSSTLVLLVGMLGLRVGAVFFLL